MTHPRPNKNRHENSARGMSLVEVLIAGSMFAFFAAGVIHFFGELNSVNRVSLVLDARDKLVDRFRNAIRNPQILLESSKHANNTDFKKCMDPAMPVASDCTATENIELVDEQGRRRKNYPLTLVDPNAPTTLLSTGGLTPVRYNMEGKVCSEASAQCLFEVFTDFRAVCPAAAGACDTPETFLLFYRIRITKAVKLSKDIARLSEATNTPLLGAPAPFDPNPPESGEAVSYILLDRSRTEPETIFCESSCGGRYPVNFGSFTTSANIRAHAFAVGCTTSLLQPKLAGAIVALCSKR